MGEVLGYIEALRREEQTQALNRVASALERLSHGEVEPGGPGGLEAVAMSLMTGVGRHDGVASAINNVASEMSRIADALHLIQEDLRRKAFDD